MRGDFALGNREGNGLEHVSRKWLVSLAALEQHFTGRLAEPFEPIVETN
jgi:hypothetical protein